MVQRGRERTPYGRNAIGVDSWYLLSFMFVHWSKEQKKAHTLICNLVGVQPDAPLVTRIR